MSEPEDLLCSLPADRREAVRAAIAAAFPGQTVAARPAPLPGGLSARTWRIEVGGRYRVLRLEGPPNPLRDPVRAYACLQAAATAGLAPAVHWADAQAGILLLDHVEGRPLASFAGGPPALAAALGGLVARLQRLPAFPPLMPFPDLVARLFGFVHQSPLFAAGVLDPVAERFEELRAQLARDPMPSAPAHNDPNPQNLLYDGERLWLIDWETAFQGDPLTDIAIVADSFAKTPELETALLDAWANGIGTSVTVTLRERLQSMRLLTRLWYASLLLSGAARQPPPVPHASRAALTPAAFQQALAEGRLRADSPEMPFQLGLLLLASFVPEPA